MDSERRPLPKRLGESFAAFLMWLIFGVMAIAFLACFPLLIVQYALTGQPAHRDAVKLPGKSLDQLCNCAYFGGHPKETLSSHAGRWLYSDPGRAPWWVHVVDRVTGWFERGHVIEAIEEPFLGEPLE